MGAKACVVCKKVHEYDVEEAFEILRKTPDTLRELLDAVNFETFSHKDGKQWSPRQLLIHLIDAEYVYGFRYRLIMGEKEPVISPFDQEQWVDTFQYGDQDATQLIRAFTPIRRVNLELLQNVDRELFDKPAKHPVWGNVTVRELVLHLASHDTSHLEQIRDRIPAV